MPPFKAPKIYEESKELKEFIAGKPKKLKAPKSPLYARIDAELKKKLDHFLIDKNMSIAEWIERKIEEDSK